MFRRLRLGESGLPRAAATDREPRLEQLLRSNNIAVPEECPALLCEDVSFMQKMILEDKSSAVFLPAGAVGAPTPVDEAQSAELEEQLQDCAMLSCCRNNSALSFV